MNQDILIVFGVFAGMAILFVTNRIRSDLVALMALLALMLFGVLTIEEALAGFAEPDIIIIASMFIVSEALVHTGIAQAVGRFVLETGGGSETRLTVLLMLAVGIVGAFMNSTAAIAIFIPIAMTVATACSAAFVTPISSPVNMLVMEPGGYRFIDFVKVGLRLLLLTLIATVVLVGIIYI